MSSSNIANGLNTHVAPHYSEQSDSSRPSTGQPQSQPQKFTPFTTGKHHVTKGRYITSNDPRGYVPVYEYPLNGQWIMMDVDDGYILWTGIWKALGNSKADIVKMIESQPDLAPQLRRVRGGYLKIQGTWMPYEVAMKLSRRVAWTIREDLVPLFGHLCPVFVLALPCRHDTPFLMFTPLMSRFIPISYAIFTGTSSGLLNLPLFMRLWSYTRSGSL
ncbi:DNA-binding domain of Mlu1-box binding protein MBP1 [Sistotremastrum suecicum HHB10207 ss-3]|uniref:DNA-binding domain of Mlu1-box binding protein MBP1 n=1 Tax=Sistotremastrum suecicum HHB10207 ss-3 TaxID=1314776 RepID=A0A166FB77_9AGAM|nr:DNA-binding domain of Mlu1-box binding protein MBP1 [Sistotremastrum suecicum HHB10207 ss-3]